jgi:hypothetical protein
MKYRISWTGPGTEEVAAEAVLFTSRDTANLAAAVFRALSPNRDFWVEPAEEASPPSLVV